MRKYQARFGGGRRNRKRGILRSNIRDDTSDRADRPPYFAIQATGINGIDPISQSKGWLALVGFDQCSREPFQGV